MKTRRAFAPKFAITAEMASDLMRIEACRQTIESLPITAKLLAHLRETARLFSTHYSTMIEGNRLTQEQVALVLRADSHFPGRERDEEEVKGYYAALDLVETLARRSGPVTETAVRSLHGLVMGAGRKRVKATPYREGQNVIRDSRSKKIVYMPPEAKDVPRLMSELVAWLETEDALPVPLKAAIAHYQYATVHPYYDGNGRTARLLTTLILHLGGYGLKGLYALEEYYARDLPAYYEALTVGPSHNYYLGRAEADITGWIAYFIEGMATAFGNVEREARDEAAAGAVGRTEMLRQLDARQRKSLELFRGSRHITAKDVGESLGVGRRAGAALCQRWVADGFLVVADASRKGRRYRLADEFEAYVTRQDVLPVGVVVVRKRNTAE